MCLTWRKLLRINNGGRDVHGAGGTDKEALVAHEIVGHAHGVLGMGDHAVDCALRPR